MKTLTTTFILTTLLIITPVTVIAGTGHSHKPAVQASTPVNQSTAEKNANKVIVSLIERKKIDESWSIIKASSVEKKNLHGRTEWVAIYRNETIAEKDKQTLYVFLNIGGQYLAVNYTGK